MVMKLVDNEKLVCHVDVFVLVIPHNFSVKVFLKQCPVGDGKPVEAARRSVDEKQQRAQRNCNAIPSFLPGANVEGNNYDVKNNKQMVTQG